MELLGFLISLIICSPLLLIFIRMTILMYKLSMSEKLEDDNFKGKNTNASYKNYIPFAGFLIYNKPRQHKDHI